jgi:hypothetical protein
VILRTRKPDHRKFRSPLRQRARRKREYFYASISILVVKIVLFAFLCVLISVSVRLFNNKFAHLSTPVRYAVPGLIAIFTAVLGFFIYKNIMELKDYYNK